MRVLTLTNEMRVLRVLIIRWEYWQQWPLRWGYWHHWPMRLEYWKHWPMRGRLIPGHWWCLQCRPPSSWLPPHWGFGWPWWRRAGRESVWGTRCLHSWWCLSHDSEPPGNKEYIFIIIFYNNIFSPEGRALWRVWSTSPQQSRRTPALPTWSWSGPSTPFLGWRDLIRWWRYEI